MRIGVAQLNLLVGDIENNTAAMLDVAARARDFEHAGLVIFPELAITGYPPEDLLLRPALYRQVETALRRMEQAARGIDIIVGLPESDSGNLYNCCRYLRDGRTFAAYRKRVLPNYGVFDEKRYFTPGAGVQIVDIGGIPCSLSICEDLWTPDHARDSAQNGAKVLININGSPYHADKYSERNELLMTRMRESGLAIIYANLVGGQDELIFDGGSMAIDAAGSIVQLAPQFREGLFVLEMNAASGTVSLQNAGKPAPPLSRIEGIYQALVLGVHDYVVKNRFNGVVLGLSGGIDSALTLCIAVDALGTDKVEALIMPSRFTSNMSVEDAKQLAERLRVAYRIISIEGTFTAFNEALGPMFGGLPRDTTEENIQARCRGVLLMAASNKTGRMVLTTGNKSESSVGYATLYGDMAGGFAPLKDVFKTTVYELAGWRNRSGELIPRRTIDRPPTAELRPDQKDVDSLPPYDLLDPILERYVERDEGPEEIIKHGFNPETVRRVTELVDRNEYKRRQAAPGIKISKRAFGRDRRYPITSRYREV